MAKKGLQSLMKTVQQSSAERRESHRLDVDDLGGGRQLPQSGKVIRIEQIKVSPYQPRLEIDETLLEGLRDSMRSSGLSTPILVRPINGEDVFELIDGHRRVVAAKMLEWDEIPAHVRELTDAEAAIQALVTNVEREGYSDYELGWALKRLLEGNFVKSKKALEELTGISRPGIYRALGMTELPDSMRAILDRYPSLIGGNTGDILRKMVDAGDEALGVMALQKIIDASLKESHLPAWWGLQKRQQSQSQDSALRPHVIRQPGYFEARVRPGARGSIAINIRAANGVDSEELRRVVVGALEALVQQEK